MDKRDARFGDRPGSPFAPKAQMEGSEALLHERCLEGESERLAGAHACGDHNGHGGAGDGCDGEGFAPNASGHGGRGHGLRHRGMRGADVISACNTTCFGEQYPPEVGDRWRDDAPSRVCGCGKRKDPQADRRALRLHQECGHAQEDEAPGRRKDFLLLHPGSSVQSGAEVKSWGGADRMS